jgi:UTP--glucose-1-phosphate uridylyltransferase
MKQMVDVAARENASVIGVMNVLPEETASYGIVEADSEPAGERIGRITRIVEKPKPGTSTSTLAVVGRYVLSPRIFHHLRTMPPGAGGEIQLTDALRELAASPAGMVGVFVAGTRHDAGDKLGYLRANLAYALKRPELRDAVLALCREMLGGP